MSFFRKLRRSMAIVNDLGIISFYMPYVEAVANEELAALRKKLDKLRNDDPEVREFLEAVKRTQDRL